MLSRNLRIKRLYTAGQYQNLEFTDEIEGIPENLALDEHALRMISNIMILRLDEQERRYFSIREKTRGLSHEEVINILEDQRAQETQKLLAYLEQKGS